MSFQGPDLVIVHLTTGRTGLKCSYLCSQSYVPIPIGNLLAEVVEGLQKLLAQIFSPVLKLLPSSYAN